MSRITPRPAPYPAELKAHFDQVMPPGVPPLVLFTTLARSERAWTKFRAGSLLDGRLLSLRERELIIDRTCARAGCEYEWGVHVTAFAAAAGLGSREIAATRQVPLPAESFVPREVALLRAVDALHDRASWSREEFDALQPHYDDAQLLEILLLCGFYRTVSYLANALELPLEPTAARFDDYA